MSTQTASSEALTSQVEIGTLVTRGLEMDTRQLVTPFRGIRNARFRFADPGTPRQAPLPHR